MSLDRVVRWKERKPTPEEVKKLLEDFFNGAASITWDKDRYFISFSTFCKPALLQISPIYQREGWKEESVVARSRWIEVWEDEKRTCLYVMTRQQDDFVNSLAIGLVEVFSRYWQGKVDES